MLRSSLVFLVLWEFLSWLGVVFVKCLFCVHCYDHLPFPFINIMYYNDSQLRGLLPERHLVMAGDILAASQGVLVVKNLPASAGDVRGVGSIPGSGRPTGGGHGSPLPYSCLENPMDREAWRAPVHRVTQSRTRLKRLHRSIVAFSALPQFSSWSNAFSVWRTFYFVDLFKKQVLVSAIFFFYYFPGIYLTMIFISSFVIYTLFFLALKEETVMIDFFLPV